MSFIIVLIISSHFIADYVLQNEWLVKKKDDKWWAILLHAAIFLLLTLLIVHPWLSMKNALIVLVISISHGIIDYFKNQLRKKWSEFQFELELIDQWVHLLCIGLVVHLFNNHSSDNTLKYSILSIISQKLYLCIVINISALGILLRAANIWIRELMLKVRNSSGKKIDKTGRLIGNLERVLIFVMILFNQWAAIGFIITAKSIARFEEFKKKKKKFAEYYIIGTLSSTLIAISVGKLVQYLISII